MEIPSSIAELAHFVGGEVVFVDVCDGVIAYHCEQREGVRESWIPFDFQVRVLEKVSETCDFATLLFAGRDGKTVEIALEWIADMYTG
jgi:hypothetical protein